MTLWKRIIRSPKPNTSSSRNSRAGARRTNLQHLEERRVFAAAQVADIYPGALSSTPTEIVNLNGTAIFAADDGLSGVELFASDGTPGNLTLVKDIHPGFDGSLFGLPYNSNPHGFLVMGGYAYFAADNGINGVELWRTDGTEQGTSLVKDINEGDADSNPGNFAVLNGELYFTADDGVNGVELWKTNGSEAGTVLVQDIRSGELGSNPTSLVASDGLLYFAADDGVNGRELWVTTPNGTGVQLVNDIRDGVEGSSPTFLTDVNGTVFYAATGDNGGVELYATSGISDSRRVRDIRPGVDGSNPASLVNVGGVLYFTADNGVNGVELWRSDGTNAGTSLVADIRPGALGSNPLSLIGANGGLMFKADNGVNGVELWRSDGSAAGTALVLDIKAGAGSSNPTFLTDATGVLLFAADNGVNGVELWQSDATAGGTALVEDINVGAGSSSPAFLAVVGNRLVFRATTAADGAELWSADIPNRKPVGVADQFAYTVDTALDAPAAGVLANDTDPDGNAITATLLTTTTNGVLVLNADGSFTYTPNAGFRGVDTFTYQADDGAGGLSAPVTARLVSQDYRWIERLYERLLGRTVAATEAEVNFWIARLTAGAERGQVVQEIQASQEYLNNVVNDLYNEVFNRGADVPALVFWTGLLRQGTSATEIEAALLASNEYRSALAQSDLAFVSQLYRDLLGRNPVTAESVGWRNALSNGASRATVATAILNSVEYRSGAVIQAYRTLLRREPDAAGLNFALSQLQAGVSLQSFEAILASSDEFYLA